MIRATSAALLLFLLAATGAVCWLAYDAHLLLRHLDGVAVRAEGIETKANATLINLDKGTAVWAASAKSQAGAVEDLATDAHGTLSQANTALAGVSGVAQHVQGTADAATSLLASAQQATDQVPTTLATMNQTIGDFQPVLSALARSADSANKAVIDFDALVNSPDLSHALSHVEGMTASGDAILGDARKVADKTAADWLKPVPWWKQPIKKSGQLIDIGAALARHTP
jgi:hypothetical protein